MIILSPRFKAASGGLPFAVCFGQTLTIRKSA